MRFQAINHNICIRPTDWEYTTPSGIVLPSSAKDTNPIKGTVINCGPGNTDESDVFQQMPVKPGDTVIVHKGPMYPEFIDEDGIRHIVVGQADVLAVIE